MVCVPCHQRWYDPRVTITSEAHGVRHLKDGVGLLLGAVEQNDGALQLLQLVLDLEVAVVYRHVQQQHLLQLPAHKAVLYGATDLRNIEKN